jgi:hypothetical protein
LHVFSISYITYPYFFIIKVFNVSFYRSGLAAMIYILHPSTVYYRLVVSYQEKMKTFLNHTHKRKKCSFHNWSPFLCKYANYSDVNLSIPEHAFELINCIWLQKNAPIKIHDFSSLRFISISPICYSEKL